MGFLFGASFSVIEKNASLFLRANNEEWFVLQRDYSEMETKIDIEKITNHDKRLLYCCEQLHFYNNDISKMHDIYTGLEDSLLVSKSSQIDLILCNALDELVKEDFSVDVAKLIYDEYLCNWHNYAFAQKDKIFSFLLRHNLTVLLVAPRPNVIIKALEKGADGILLQKELSKDEEKIFFYQTVPCTDLKTNKLLTWDEKREQIDSFKARLKNNKLVKDVIKSLNEDRFEIIDVEEDDIWLIPKYDYTTYNQRGIRFNFEENGLKTLNDEQRRYLRSVILEETNGSYVLQDYRDLGTRLVLSASSWFEDECEDNSLEEW